jgi:hypothetical protein
VSVDEPVPPHPKFALRANQLPHHLWAQAAFNLIAHAVAKSPIMTFLSAQATPIAKRFEIWVPNPARSALVFHSGDCGRNTDLGSLYASKTIGKGEGSIGGAWATGMPAINEHLKLDESAASSLARATGMNQVVVLPVIENALLKAVLAWYL